MGRSKTKDLPEEDSSLYLTSILCPACTRSTGFKDNAVRSQTAPCPAGSADSKEDVHSEAEAAHYSSSCSAFRAHRSIEFWTPSLDCIFPKGRWCCVTENRKENRGVSLAIVSAVSAVSAMRLLP